MIDSDAIQVPLPFPLGGVNRAREFDRQPEGTTRTGTNVRAYDTHQRARGGSREGTRKYINERVGDFNGLVQHINCFTDPTHAALPAFDGPVLISPDLDHVLWQDVLYTLPNFLAAFPEWVVDPSGQWIVRNGGSGQQLPKTNDTKLLTITANDITKSFGSDYTFDGTEFSSSGLDVGDAVSFVGLSSPGAGAGASKDTYPIRIDKNRIFGTVGIGTKPFRQKYTVRAIGGTMTVGGLEFSQANYTHIQNFDSLLPDYTASFVTPVNVALTDDVTAGELILVFITNENNDGSLTVTDTLGNSYSEISITGYRLRVFWAISGSAGPCTVKANFSTYQFTNVAVVTYTGADQSVPLDAVADLVDTGLSTGNLAVATNGCVAVGFFSGIFFLDDVMTWTAPAGYTVRVNATLYPALLIVDKLPVDAGSITIGPVAGTLSFSGPISDCRNIGLSFKPA